jgi:3-hydroxyacyl-CoA dehydrogenase
MGMGIAQVAAQVARLPVVVMDASEQQLGKQLKFLGTQACVCECEREDADLHNC